MYPNRMHLRDGIEALLPDHRELCVYLLAYSLIRLLMALAALLADQIPRR